MLTKDVSTEIETVLNALHSEGKEPTVALVKARLTSKVPMPAIISVIKSWKSTKRVPKVEIAEQDTQQDNKLEQRVAELESQVRQLLERITLLEQKNG
ncbi:hypothetical protein [Vibrio hippocampi]|uniref:KfrA N-terminal DNA-binding domain-containing protein n=1 Tax=Vibrio hippocampi TaxID=654686 RepID=A0ABM8ZIQ9_9VIBR|nr:hypothetical protein [Vibrio hippocampi]CAH0526699.1 hypothetical protein VHP8226_02071 [Vibrio hippocampi]